MALNEATPALQIVAGRHLARSYNSVGTLAQALCFHRSPGDVQGHFRVADRHSQKRAECPSSLQVHVTTSASVHLGVPKGPCSYLPESNAEFRVTGETPGSSMLPRKL